MVGSVIVIDETSAQHSYLQLAARLRAQILAGEISARLPSLSDLTAQTGLAVGTVRRAFDVLADEHLVLTVPGRGTFVADAPR